MEEKIKPSSDAFSEYLIEHIKIMPSLTEYDKKCLILYAMLNYGYLSSIKLVPYELANRHNLYEAERKEAKARSDKRLHDLNWYYI